jgi:iron complex transport system substrate-binding protein
MDRTLLVAAAAIASVMAVGSITAAPNAAGNLTTGCVERFDPAVDYFPAKVSIDDALNFRVEYHKSYKVVTVREAYAGGPAERYLLVQCGAPRPAHENAAAEVSVPITSLYAGSATHLSPLTDLDRLDALTGVPRLRDLGGADVQRRVAAGRIRQFAASSVIDTELVVKERPSLVMTAGGVSPSYSVIRSAGIPVVADTDWLEQTALARAEWMKFIAVFLNEERKAGVVYDAMKARYRALRARATAAAPQPLVMTGRSTNGRFVIAGGRSYVASLISDAGGRYVWAGNESTGAPAVDLEAQIQQAAQADVWINGGGWANRAVMLQDEPRYAAFKAYRAGQVWVYERRLQGSGTNEYWTRSPSRPDTVLADLVKIFHPTLLPDHNFDWYMRVPAQ